MDTQISSESLQIISNAKNSFERLGSILGIFNKKANEYFEEKKSRLHVPADEIEKLIEERREARKNKDFKRADEIRKGLEQQGILLEDTSKGTMWRVR